MIRKITVAVGLAGALTLSAATAVFAQTPPSATSPGPWVVPADAEIRRILADRIDTQHQGVGIVVGVVDAHGRRFVSYGVSDKADGRPVDQRAVFEIGSMSKVFTSLLLADMVQRGEVKLDDPISKYLPAGVKVPERRAPAPARVGMSQFEVRLRAGSWPTASRAFCSGVRATVVELIPSGPVMR